MLNNNYRELNYKSSKSHIPYFSNTFALSAPKKNTPVQTGVFFYALHGSGIEPLAKQSIPTPARLFTFRLDGIIIIL